MHGNRKANEEQTGAEKKTKRTDRLYTIGKINRKETKRERKYRTRSECGPSNVNNASQNGYEETTTDLGAAYASPTKRPQPEPSREEKQRKENENRVRK